MKKVFIIISMLVIFPTAVIAAQTAYLNREIAIQSLDKDLGEQLAANTYNQLKGQSAAQSRHILQQLQQRPELSVINREYTYLILAEIVRFQGADELDPAVLDYLMNYQSHAQVLHPESTQGTIPVFNIRATAAGARVLQQRENDLLTARGLGQQPGRVLQHYLSAPAVSQRALRDAVLQLPTLQQQQLLVSSLQQLTLTKTSQQTQSALTDISAALALQQMDVTALAVIIGNADNQKLPNLLRKIDSALPPEQSKPLFYLALSSSPEAAAIAIHYLGQFSNVDTGIYHDLLDWLAQPQTAAAAALALSTSKHPKLKTDLQHLSSSTQPVTARNARLALELMAEAAREEQL